MRARLVSWSVVHAVALVVFGRVVQTFVPSPLGLAPVSIFAAVWLGSVVSWAGFAKHETSPAQDAIACCLTSIVWYGILFIGASLAFGTHWTESLRKVGPYFGALITPLLLLAQASVAVGVEKSPSLAELREFGTGLVFQGVGLALYLAKRGVPWINNLGSFPQLMLAYLVVVCPAFWYSRFLGAYLSSRKRKVPIVIAAVVASGGTLMLAF